MLVWSFEPKTLWVSWDLESHKNLLVLLLII